MQRSQNPTGATLILAAGLGTPKALTIGAAQAALSHDGTHAIIVTANWSAGLWRYVEP